VKNRREHELKNNSKWRKYWKTLQKKESPQQREAQQWERTFLLNLMVKFMTILDTISEQGDTSQDKVHYCERFLELMIDLEALLPTRRFFNTVLDDCHLVTRCKLSDLCKRDDGQLFSQVGPIFLPQVLRQCFTYLVEDQII
jgi:intron-binding protein aquarius